MCGGWFVLFFVHLWWALFVFVLFGFLPMKGTVLKILCLLFRWLCR